MAGADGIGADERDVDPDVEAVLFGADGVASGLSKGKLVIDMSSISPVATKQFAEKIKALGVNQLYGL